MKNQVLSQPIIFSDEEFCKIILSSKRTLLEMYMNERVDLISNLLTFSEEQIKELIRLGWLCEMHTCIDTTVSSLITDKIESYGFEYSPDCKSPFLYRLHYYLAANDQYKSQEILDQIYEKAIPQNGKLFWDYKSSSGDRYINWGLSHGIAGIASFILHGLENGTLNHSRNFEVLDEISKSILEDSYLKQILSTHGKETTNCFLTFGYCYGVLPILFILLRISLQIDNRDLQLFCETNIIQLSKFQPKEGHFDHYYLCHGYTGVALTFYSGYKRLKHKYIYEASKTWINFTQNALENNRSSILNTLNNNLDSSLLFGTPGIDLTIASINGETKVPWYLLLGY